jgi:hypothetical protein
MFVTSLLIGGCSNKRKLPPKEFIGFLSSSESGLTLKKNFNGINYKARMYTPELLALTQSESPINSEPELKKKAAECSDRLNFIFFIEDESKINYTVKSTVFDKQRYGAIMAYANTDMKNDFMLVQGKDTLACSILHLEPANSVHPLLRISLGFNGVNPTTKEYTLVYNDNIFNNGPIKFHYSQSTFDHLPEVKL